jgi:hypothetical protein
MRLKIRKFLRPFIQQETEKLAQSALQAALMKDQKEFITEKEQRTKVVPVNENSGIIQNSSHMSNGLHEFVEVKWKEQKGYSVEFTVSEILYL